MSAEHQVAEHAPTAGEYITHHLQHWQKNFALVDQKQHGIVDFSVFNLDSLIYSVVLGFLAGAGLGAIADWRLLTRFLRRLDDDA